MVDRLGELARSYWMVVSTVIAAAVAWGVMYQKLDGATSTLAKLDARFDQVVTATATNTEHGKATDVRLADIIDRVRALERQR